MLGFPFCLAGAMFGDFGLSLLCGRWYSGVMLDFNFCVAGALFG